MKRDAGQSRILLMPTDIELQELTAGGVLEPKAEWTEQAKEYLSQALHEQEQTRNLRFVAYDEASASQERSDELHQLYKLYAAVGAGIFNHQFSGPLQLPTKAKGFDWSLGPAMKALGQQYGADYALLTFVRDSYSSAGRQALIVLAAIARVGVRGGQVETWTIDGEPLDSIIFFAGIADGQPLIVLAQDKGTPLAPFRTAMTPNDIMELFEAMLTRITGTAIARSRDLRPAKLGSADGFRFEIDYTPKNEVDHTLSAVGAVADGKLHLIAFQADKLYHYQKYLPEFEQIVTSANLLRS